MTNKTTIDTMNSNGLQKIYDQVLGIDESGKGDFFGPLVIAGVYIEDQQQSRLMELKGVRDSKKLSDAAVLRLAPIIEHACKIVIVKIGPEKYNQLYEKIKNLNKLLAWGHARVIENFLQEATPKIIISDKFGDESFIKSRLMEKGRKANLLQQVRAESNIAVACASIIARAEFLNSMKKLSSQFGIEFPRGGGNVRIDDALGSFIDKFGMDKLHLAAKMHFKNVKNIGQKKLG